MEKRSLLAPLLVFGGLLALCFVFAIALFQMAGKEKTGANAWTEGTGPKIGVVEINGVIEQSRTAIEHLVEFRRDKDIKAIVVRIDSPGGAVAPSQEIYRAVERAQPNLCRRFIFMTGFRGEPKITEFIGSVGGFILWKPFEFRVLMEAIKRIEAAA